MKGVFRFINQYASSFLVLFLLLTAGTAAFVMPELLQREICETLPPYYAEQNRSDAVISSALGFEADDRMAISRLPGVASIEETYSDSVILSADKLVRKVQLITLSEKTDKAELISGRLPEALDECVLGEGYQELSVHTGDQILLYPDEEGKTLPIKTDCLKVVGLVRHPAFLYREQEDFVLVHPDLLEMNGTACTQLLLRTDASREELFSKNYEEQIASLQAVLEAYSERFTGDKLKNMETDLLQQEAQKLAGIESRLNQLEADEQNLKNRGEATENHLLELQQNYDEAKIEWDAAQAVRDATNAHFEAIKEELQEKGNRLEQLRSIDKIVRGELNQVETVLGNKDLKPMLSVFRGCAESILSAFLKADLTKPSVMETAVETARSRWESEWDTFRTGLSAETAHEIEHSISRSLVSLGIQISNQLRDYGNTLQSAGSQNEGLQEEIRTIVNERGSGALSTAISTRITELRNEIAAQEEEFAACSETLAQDEAVLKEKQDACSAVGRELLLAKSVYEDWKAEEEGRIAAERKILQQEKADAEAAFRNGEAQLQEKRKEAWTYSDIRSDTAIRDLGLVSELARKNALWAGVCAGLAMLAAAAALMARMVSHEKKDLVSRELLRSGSRDILRKSALSLFLPVLPGVLAGALLGRVLAGLAARRSWSSYVLSGSRQESFLHTVGLLLPAVVAIFLAAAGLGMLIARIRKGSWLECAAAFLSAGLMSLVGGGFLWLGWGLFRSGQTIAETAPAFTSLERIWSVLTLLLVVFLLLLLLPGPERLHAEEKSLQLALMRANGYDRKSCESYLRRQTLWSAAFGALTGAGLGWFALRALLPHLVLLDAQWKQLPVWLIWPVSALLAWILVTLIPAGIRRYAAADALTDTESLEGGWNADF